MTKNDEETAFTRRGNKLVIKLVINVERARQAGIKEIDIEAELTGLRFNVSPYSTTEEARDGDTAPQPII
jgi:hypothetical protein